MIYEHKQIKEKMLAEKREIASYPKGSNIFEKKTTAIRLSTLGYSDVFKFLEAEAKNLELPFYANKVSAGFPSPTDDYIESCLDLNTHLINHPSSTFL